MNWETGAPTPSLTISGMGLAKEFGEDGIYAKLKAYAEENYEPTWDVSSGSSPGASD